MPIFEYGCSACRVVFQFWTQRIHPEHSPTCPKCGNTDLQKMVSTFAVNKKRDSAAIPSESEDPAGMGDPFANMSPEQQAHAEREMMKLMSQADSIDENDPRQMGAFMRKMMDSTGMDPGAEINEAIRRLESGEDPEKIEEEFGPLFEGMEDEMAGGPAGRGGGWSYDDNLYDY